MDLQTHKAFRNHPFIKSIEDKPKWTISDQRKMPIDMKELIEKNRLKGANFHNESSLVTLTELDDFFLSHNQIPTNHAFYMDVMLDNFVVLDVESDCPDDIKERLLKTPYIYGEISMSGKGLHLVFPTPKCFMDFPNAQQKPALKEEHKYYEVLLNHFCTFTGIQLPPADNPTEDFNEIFRELASSEKNIAKQREVNITELETKPDTKWADRILEILLKAAKDYKKSPDSFKKEKAPLQNDMSRYEWAYISYLNYKLGSILAVSAIAKEHTYTDEEKAYFLYTIIKEVLPHREKHDTYRTTQNGDHLPWLAYLVKDVMEKTTDSDH